MGAEEVGEAMIRAYWFFGNTLRNGRPIPADGEWTEVKGRLELCKHGLHASLEPFDALRYTPGPNLALVELGGDVVRGDWPEKKRQHPADIARACLRRLEERMP